MILLFLKVMTVEYTLKRKSFQVEFTFSFPECKRQKIF